MKHNREFIKITRELIKNKKIIREWIINNKRIDKNIITELIKNNKENNKKITRGLIKK